MASLRQQQDARDAADFDNDRKDGRYAAGGDRAGWYPAETVPLEPHKQAALDEAMAQIERAFGKWDREKGRHIPAAASTVRAAA